MADDWKSIEFYKIDLVNSSESSKKKRAAEEFLQPVQTNYQINYSGKT